MATAGKAIGSGLRQNSALADLRGGARDAPPPLGSKFFHFHAVFGKNLKNNSNFGSWRTPLGKILDPPLLSFRPLPVRQSAVAYSHRPLPVRQSAVAYGETQFSELKNSF